LISEVGDNIRSLKLRFFDNACGSYFGEDPDHEEEVLIEEITWHSF
jgi:hypothetical protein